MKCKQNDTDMLSEPSIEPRGSADNIPPSDHYQTTQPIDMSHGFFNNVGRDQLTVVNYCSFASVAVVSERVSYLFLAT